MSRLPLCLLALCACADLVEPVTIPRLDEPGASFLVFRTPGAPLELVAFSEDDLLERPRDSDTEVFLIRVTETRARKAHPRVDLSRLTGTLLEPASAQLVGCEGPGLIEAFEAERRIELPLEPIAEVLRLGDAGFQPQTLPTELESWSARIPLPEICPDRRRELRPFGRTSPVIGTGTVVLSVTVTPDLTSVFNARGVAYLSRDLAAVANGRFVYVLPRGGTIEDASVWDVESLPPWASEDAPLGWRIESFQLAESSSMAVGRALLLASAVSRRSPPAEIVMGQSVLELELTADRIRVLGTRYSGRAERLLRRARPVPPRSFIAVGDGIVVYEEDGAPVRIESDASGFDLVDATYVGPMPPHFAFASTTGSWFVGRPTASISSLTREPSIGVTRPASGHRLSVLPGASGPRLFGSTNQPAVLEREPAGWRPVNIWLPTEMLGCSSGVRVCGRASLGLGGAKDLLAVDEERLAFSLVDCPGVLVFDPDRDECADAATGPLEIWAESPLVGPNHLAAHEDRILLGGEGGLLVEVVAPGAD